MFDYRHDLIRSIELSLSSVLEVETLNEVTNKIICVLSNYEITERCTEIIPFDDTNTRIIKRYAACLNIDGKSKKTIYAYTREIKKFSAFIGKPLPEVGVYDIRYYLATEKQRGVSDRSLENTRSYLAAFYQWMTNEELIPKNPCLCIKPIKYLDKQRLPFSSIEMDKLRHACKTPRERALIEMLATSGVRVSELSGMNVEDIDFSTLAVIVHNGKGGKERTTYINDVARSHVQKYLLSRHDTNTCLICNNIGGRIKPDSIRILLKTIGERAGVDNVHPHRFRRTFATGLAARGMAVQEIQKLLGHTNVNTTLQYVSTDNMKVRASYNQYIA